MIRAFQKWLFPASCWLERLGIFLTRDFRQLSQPAPRWTSYLRTMTCDMYTPGSAKLNNGAEVPLLGLGCYDPANPDSIGEAILVAAHHGYLHYDTAKFYENERVVGQALRKSGIPRDKIFLTTKLWNTDHHDVEAAFDESLEKLDLEYIDMYLMHWPQATMPDQRFKSDDSIDYIKTWKAMEQLLKTRAGKVKGIGVSNFRVKTLTELLKHAEIVPAMNQIETHPYNQDRDLVRLCQEKGIVVTAYSPLGMALSPMPEDRDIVSVAQATGVTPEQIILSWNVQRHVVVIPKSLNPVHIEQNMKMVKLNEEQTQRIDAIANDPERRCRRFCPAYDPQTDTVAGWTYEQLGWEKP